MCVCVCVSGQQVLNEVIFHLVIWYASSLLHKVVFEGQSLTKVRLCGHRRHVYKVVSALLNEGF